MRTLINLSNMKDRTIRKMDEKLIRFMTAKSCGIDGLLVTVGLCVIALVLCVVMKDGLESFIKDIVSAMQAKAEGILGVPPQS